MSQDLDELKAYFDEKFSEIKRDFSKPAVTPVVKPVVLKSKGLQDQLDFNCELLSLVHNLECLTNPLENGEISDICAQITKKLNRRVKLIKLADKSPAGWLVVKEYEQDDLASDDEDGRKIKKAEKSALAILKERDEMRNSLSKNNYVPRYSPYNLGNMSGLTGNVNRPVMAPQAQGYSNFRPYTYNNQWRQRFNSGPRTTDQCFACGRFGHYRSTCPHNVFNQKPGGFAALPGTASAISDPKKQ